MIRRNESDAPIKVDRGERRLNNRWENRKRAIKKHHGVNITWCFFKWWAITGSNWFHREHDWKEQKRRANHSESRMQEVK